MVLVGDYRCKLRRWSPVCLCRSCQTEGTPGTRGNERRTDGHRHCDLLQLNRTKRKCEQKCVWCVTLGLCQTCTCIANKNTAVGHFIFFHAIYTLNISSHLVVSHDGVRTGVVGVLVIRINTCGADNL